MAQLFPAKAKSREPLMVPEQEMSRRTLDGSQVFRRARTEPQRAQMIDEFEDFDAAHTADAFRDVRIRSASRWSKDGRPYEYAIQLPAWKRDSGSTEELFAEKLNLEMVELFGTGVTALPNGHMDVKHGYIKVAATVEKLEEWAEEDQLRVRVKPWIGGGYKTFTRKRKTEGMFTHPGCNCQRQEDCEFCCATATQEYSLHPEKCRCLILLPYQTQLLVKRRIDRSFDCVYRDRAREAAKAKGQNIMLGPDDVRKFLIKFCEHGGVPPDVGHRLLDLFKDVDGEEFQRLSKVEMARLVTPAFGTAMTSHLFDAVAAETADNIIVPAGQGLVMALKEKTVVQVYPLHTLQNSDTDLYPTRREVLRQYCSWVNSIGTCMIFGKQSSEFLDFMRDYLGEKIALYFAFLHYYTTWLVPLAVVGTPLVFTQWTSASFDSTGIIVYCTIVALWSTIMLEFWQRQNAQLTWKWDMANWEGHEEELEGFDHVGGDNLGFYEKEGGWVEMTDYIRHARETGRGQVVKMVRFQHRDKKSPLPDCFCCVPGTSEARQEFASWFWRFCKEMLSWSVVGMLLVLVCFMTLLLLYFRLVMQDVNEVFGGLVAGSMNAFMITTLDFLFEGLAIKLTTMENHRTSTRFEDQLIAKQFTFQFINSYFSLFYIAFFKGGRVFRETNDPTLFGRSDRCKDVEGNDTDSCMAELAYQLTAMFITRLLIGNLLEYWAPHAQYKAAMWKLWFGNRKTMKEQHPNWSADRVKDEINRRQQSHHFQVQRQNTMGVDYLGRKRDEYRKKHPGWSEEKIEQRVQKHLHQHRSDKFDAAEKQAFQAPYGVMQMANVSGTFYDYAELAIQFGYVTIFAPAFPLAPFVAIISNVLEHRTDAYKILVSCQRPSYKGAQDMGTWLAIFQLISYVAVITNFLIIAFTSSQLDNLLDDPSTALKLAVVVIAEHLVFALKGAIVYSIPAEPYNVRVAQARANEIQRAETEFRDYLDWVGKQNTHDSQFSSFQEKQAYKQHLRDHAHALLYENADLSDFEVEDLDPMSRPNEIESGADMLHRASEVALQEEEARRGVRREQFAPPDSGDEAAAAAAAAAAGGIGSNLEDLPGVADDIVHGVAEKNDDGDDGDDEYQAR